MLTASYVVLSCDLLCLPSWPWLAKDFYDVQQQLSFETEMHLVRPPTAAATACVKSVYCKERRVSPPAPSSFGVY